ncbi:hypothetical protein [Sphingobium sp. KCTC 72723]|uniref:hypothetical protein n=1 Tax=Sphingobium sp. KCTC 72723 TaxID=2733867 RepID=UPI00165DF1AC|nr:hypothetical protein [Sphingobium sp. KCTC 72723]
MKRLKTKIPAEYIPAGHDMAQRLGLAGKDAAASENIVAGMHRDIERRFTVERPFDFAEMWAEARSPTEKLIEFVSRMSGPVALVAALFSIGLLIY